VVVDKVDKVDKVSEPPETHTPDAVSHNGYQPGDILRRLGGLKRNTFKVKRVVDGNVDCWELEAGVAGKLRTFPVGELVLVERRGD
jgi:hypothetical protein